jgi:hypothetical protein
VETVAATDDVPPRVDALQYQTAQGPCLDAIFEDVTYLIDDLTSDERWPAFSRRPPGRPGCAACSARHVQHPAAT